MRVRVRVCSATKVLRSGAIDDDHIQATSLSTADGAAAVTATVAPSSGVRFEDVAAVAERGCQNKLNTTRDAGLRNVVCLRGIALVTIQCHAIVSSEGKKIGGERGKPEWGQGDTEVLHTCV